MSSSETSLTLRQRLGFGLGHIQNDLVGSLWLTYLLLYYHVVLKFDNTYAGFVLLAGQISDSISTVFVGYFADKEDDFFLCRIFNRRKAWHIFGTVCVFVFCPFIFLKCIGCSDSSDQAQLFYYVMLSNVVQFGWGAVQISHLAMITELTPCPNQRIGLTAIRNAATVLSTIFLYVVAWYFLGSRERGESERIGPEDDDAFRSIVFVCMAFGLFTTLLYYVLVKHDNDRSATDSGVEAGERQPLILSKTRAKRPDRKTGKMEAVDNLMLDFGGTEALDANVGRDVDEIAEVESEEKKRVVHDPRRVVRYSFAESIRHEREFESDREPEVYLTNFEEVLEGEIQRAKSAERRKQMTIRRWFKQPQLYQITFIYLTTRLFTNMSQVYIPLYLQITLSLPATSVATVPLVTYISGFVASLILERGKFVFRKRDAFYAGSLLALAGCIWVHFGSPMDENFTTKQIYGVAILFGFGSSVMMVTSLALTADFIGPNVESSAFVYGFMSLTDKTCNGVAVLLIQNYIPEIEDPHYRSYFSSALSYGCGAAVVIGLVTLLTLWSTVIGTRKLSETCQGMSKDGKPEVAPLMMGENRRK